VRREKEIHLHIITYFKYIYGYLVTYIRNSISFFLQISVYSKVFATKDAFDVHFLLKTEIIFYKSQNTDYYNQWEKKFW